MDNPIGLNRIKHFIRPLDKKGNDKLSLLNIFQPNIYVFLNDIQAPR